MLTSKGVRPGCAAGLAVMMAAAASAAADPLTITPDVNPAPAGVAVTFTIDAQGAE